MLCRWCPAIWGRLSWPSAGWLAPAWSHLREHRDARAPQQQWLTTCAECHGAAQTRPPLAVLMHTRMHPHEPAAGVTTCAQSGHCSCHTHEQSSYCVCCLGSQILDCARLTQQTDSHVAKKRPADAHKHSSKRSSSRGFSQQTSTPVSGEAEAALHKEASDHCVQST